METTIKDVTDKEAAAGREFRDITWATVAAKHCRDLYDLLYQDRLIEKSPIVEL